MGELFDAAKEVLKVSIDQKQSDFMERIYKALEQGKKHLEIQMGDCSEAYVKMFAKWLSDEGFSATHGSESPRPPVILFRLCVNLEPFYTQPEQPSNPEKPATGSDEKLTWEQILTKREYTFRFPYDGESYKTALIENAGNLLVDLVSYIRHNGVAAKYVKNLDYFIESFDNHFVICGGTSGMILGGQMVTLVVVEPEA